MKVMSLSLRCLNLCLFFNECNSSSRESRVIDTLNGTMSLMSINTSLCSPSGVDFCFETIMMVVEVKSTE